MQKKRRNKRGPEEYPGLFPVYDAGEIYAGRRGFHLGQIARESGIQNDPEHCVFANALTGSCGAIAAQVGVRITYILERIREGVLRDQVVWVRWVNTPPTERAIKVFDQGGPAPSFAELCLPEQRGEGLDRKRSSNPDRQSGDDGSHAPVIRVTRSMSGRIHTTTRA